MIRKWEWVRNYCTLHGYEESAEIADQIDRVLCYLYGDVDTGEWRDYVRDARDGIKETGEIGLDRVEVRDGVVSASAFCIACVESRRSCHCEHDPCDACKFRELVGACNESGSLFREFMWCWKSES